MKKLLQLFITLMFAVAISKGQTNAYQFTGVDCNGNMHDLFADLDAGKAVALHFYMPNCSACPPPAQDIQAMADHINATHPGMVKGYAFPFQNSTDCAYSQSWVNSNGLSSLYVPMDSGAYQVAYYGGFGMPTVVLLGGTDHRIMFSTLSFTSSDTTIMRDSILALLNPTSINYLPGSVTAFNVYPNPASGDITLNISLKETSNLFVDIADISGKQVAIIMNEKQNSLVAKQFNITQLPNGNYLVRLNTNGKTVTQKITVKH
jgi:hypothetical protein